jgi:PAT family beta-lactamase induction signal transducer AmpG
VTDQPSVLKSKFFWIGVLYFAEGFPLGMFYDVFPVHFRQQGVDLRDIGFLSLLGLAWTLKFLWAPAIDHYRHHRRWMFAVDLAMGATLLALAVQNGFGPPTWMAIALFTLFSATNDAAIDGYSIELLDREELGLANGIRIGMYRVGMLSAGFILILSDLIHWSGAYLVAAGLLAALAVVCLRAPRERDIRLRRPLTLARELKNIFFHPRAFAIILLFALGTLWLIDSTTRWSRTVPQFWWLAFGVAGLLLTVSIVRDSHLARAGGDPPERLTEGPMFGALMEMLQRPYIWPVLGFVLIFKLGDAAMGFMVKPFWVDSGFTATQIGVVSVNIGLALSILGGIAGGWFTDRIGIFHALWMLGVAQAVSNLGYVWAATVIPAAGAPLAAWHQAVMYGASAVESFTGGLGTAAFLAFMMAIVNHKHSATEYALLSSLFALSRHLAGYASGFGAQALGYAPYFLLTFFLSFPALVLLPWVRKMLKPAAPNAATD